MFPPGMHRHRSVTEMNATTERWDDENFRNAQAARTMG